MLPVMKKKDVPTLPLAASKLKLARASAHLDALDELIRQYFSTKWCTCTFDRKDDGRQHLSMGIARVPEEFGPIVGDAVHNMRAALDLAIVELVETNGGSSNGVMFPFCEDEDSLHEMMKRRNCHRASLKVRERIVQLKPYKGGNERLRALHDLDIIDKHHTLIPNCQIATFPPVSVLTDSTGAPIGFNEGKIEFAVDPDAKPTMTFAFPETGPLAGLDVVSTLRELHAMVVQIIAQFEDDIRD